VDEPSFQFGGTSLLRGIPALDAHLSEKHHVFYILSVGIRRALEKRRGYPAKNEPDYYPIILKHIP
jgi:hypothetical protein